MNKRKIYLSYTREDLILWLVCLLQKAFFEIIYISIIFPPWQYYGFQDRFSVYRCIISWLLYIPVPAFICRSKNKGELSSMTIALILNCTYTACLILYEYQEETPFIMILVVYFMVLIAASAVIKPIRFNIGKLKNHNFDVIVNLVGILAGLIIIFIWAYYAHFRIQLNFDDVYTARMEAREYSVPTVFVYVRTMARSIVPVLALYNLHKGRRLLAVYYIFIQFIQFCIDGSKSAFFVMLLGLAVYFFADRDTKIIPKIPIAMTAGAGLAIAENQIFHTDIFSSFVFRRIMFLPALLNYQYYELAHIKGIDYFRQNLSLLGDSNYTNKIAREVGQMYYRSAGTNANNGLFADAYINLGAIGCFVMPILLVLVLKLIDGASVKLPKSIMVAYAIQLYVTITGSSFFTIFLTHGAFLMIIILYLLTPDEERRRFGNRGIV